MAVEVDVTYSQTALQGAVGQPMAAAADPVLVHATAQHHLAAVVRAQHGSEGARGLVSLEVVQTNLRETELALERPDKLHNEKRKGVNEGI